MLLQWRTEARHRTESIAENQALEIPSFCTCDCDLPIPIKANRPMTKSNVSVYYCILLIHSFTVTTVKIEMKSTIDACVNYAMQEC